MIRSVLTIFLVAATLISGTGESPSSVGTDVDFEKGKRLYEIDPEHTFVTFEVERFTMVTVVGSFPHATGTITYDPENAASIQADVMIPTERVYLGNSSGRDSAVKGPAFLDVENYPEITFTTVSVHEEDDGLVAEADLTIHGTTRRIRFPFELRGPYVDPTGLETIAVSGGVTIDRQNFGITFDKKLPGGGPFIGNEVGIEINALAVLAE